MWWYCGWKVFLDSARSVLTTCSIFLLCSLLCLYLFDFVLFYFCLCLLWPSSRQPVPTSTRGATLRACRNVTRYACTERVGTCILRYDTLYVTCTKKYINALPQLSHWSILSKRLHRPIRYLRLPFKVEHRSRFYFIPQAQNSNNKSLSRTGKRFA